MKSVSLKLPSPTINSVKFSPEETLLDIVKTSIKNINITSTENLCGVFHFRMQKHRANIKFWRKQALKHPKLISMKFRTDAKTPIWNVEQQFYLLNDSSLTYKKFTE